MPDRLGRRGFSPAATQTAEGDPRSPLPSHPSPLTLVTGATGFIGAHLVRRLLARGFRVRCLVRPTSRLDNLRNLPVELAQGSLQDADSLRRALEGCSALYHAAADYRLDAACPEQLYRTNLDGTENILQAATDQGVERVVYTSTVGALGIPKDGSPGREETPVTLDEMVGHYKRSKFQAEQVARGFACRGLPVVIVNPSTPVGPMDIKPTPTGQIIVDFLNGRMPAFVDTGLNLVAVEDVAEGHLLAAEKGRVGERYILGNRNLTLAEILQILAGITGLPAPRVRIPNWVALSLGYLDQGFSRLVGRQPRIPLEGVRMSAKKMFFDCSKAVRELELPQTPVEEALARAVEWFSENGYVRNRQSPIANRQSGQL